LKPLPFPNFPLRYLNFSSHSGFFLNLTKFFLGGGKWGFKKEWLNANKIFMLEVLGYQALRGSCGPQWGFASRPKGRKGIVE
jgi:hypothetical protein